MTRKRRRMRQRQIVGRVLKTIRVRNGKNQADMCRPLGVSQVTISRLERGSQAQPIDVVCEWFRAVGGHPSELEALCLQLIGDEQ